MAHNLNCKGIEVRCSLAPPVSLVPHSFSLLNSRHSSVMLSSHNSSRAGVPLGCQESVPYDRGSSYAVWTEKHCMVRPEARDWQMLRTQSGRNPSPLPYHETVTKKICLNSEWKKSTRTYTGYSQQPLWEMLPLREHLLCHQFSSPQESEETKLNLRNPA